MFNGKYRAFTLHDIKAFLNDNYIAVSFKFKRESNGQEIFVSHPYFDNLNNYFKKQKTINDLLSLNTKELNELKKEIEKLLSP